MLMLVSLSLLHKGIENFKDEGPEFVGILKINVLILVI